MNLSDNEKRDAVKLIQAGKPLPEKYLYKALYIKQEEWDKYTPKDFSELEKLFKHNK